jgi:hypothetical protein
MVKRTLTTVLLISCVAMLGNKCGGGDGSGGKAPTRRVAKVDENNCAPIVGLFPPGFDWLPGNDGHVVAVQDSPPGVLFFDVDRNRPQLLARDEIQSIPVDSDGDGEIDEDQRLCEDDDEEKIVSMGAPIGVGQSLAFVASSGFEQVMFFAAPDGDLVEFSVTNPPDTPSGSYHGNDYPYLPADEDERTAITTKACIYITDETNVADETSVGGSIGQHPCCNRIEDASSFMTAFTAGMALGAGHLFVATSNLDLPNNFIGSYYPGTVLVYDYDDDTAPNQIQPNTEAPVIYTTGFNPTGVTAYRTLAGRDLILVTNSGALVPLVGRENIITDSFIDVIDAQSRTLVATIPMGRAGLSFDGVSVDPEKRIGLIGSWTFPLLYAIDLRVFENEDLYTETEVVRLDGTQAGHPDARIFEADTPFEIPNRENGPHPFLCDGWTFSAINEAGDSAYVLERCDGTLTTVSLLDPVTSCEAMGNDSTCCDRVPLPESCFALASFQSVTEPFNTVTGLHGPSQIGVRPGEPGIDFTGPDVLFTVDLPEGQLCSLRVDSL